MGTLSGEATLLFLFLLPISVEVNSLKKESAPKEQILSLVSRLHFKIAALSRKENRKSQ